MVRLWLSRWLGSKPRFALGDAFAMSHADSEPDHGQRLPIGLSNEDLKRVGLLFFLFAVLSCGELLTANAFIWHLVPSKYLAGQSAGYAPVWVVTLVTIIAVTAIGASLSEYAAGRRVQLADWFVSKGAAPAFALALVPPLAALAIVDLYALVHLYESPSTNIVEDFAGILHPGGLTQFYINLSRSFYLVILAFFALAYSVIVTDTSANIRDQEVDTYEAERKALELFRAGLGRWLGGVRGALARLTDQVGAHGLSQAKTFASLDAQRKELAAAQQQLSDIRGVIADLSRTKEPLARQAEIALQQGVADAATHLSSAQEAYLAEIARLEREALALQGRIKELEQSIKAVLESLKLPKFDFTSDPLPELPAPIPPQGPQAKLIETVGVVARPIVGALLFVANALVLAPEVPAKPGDPAFTDYLARIKGSNLNWTPDLILPGVLFALLTYFAFLMMLHVVRLIAREESITATSDDEGDTIFAKSYGSLTIGIIVIAGLWLMFDYGRSPVYYQFPHLVFIRACARGLAIILVTPVSLAFALRCLGYSNRVAAEWRRLVAAGYPKEAAACRWAAAGYRWAAAASGALGFGLILAVWLLFGLEPDSTGALEPFAAVDCAKAAHGEPGTPWTFGSTRSLDVSGCRIKPGVGANFLVVIGNASYEGAADVEYRRAGDRAYSLAKAARDDLEKADPQHGWRRRGQIYVLNLGKSSDGSVLPCPPRAEPHRCTDDQRLLQVVQGARLNPGAGDLKVVLDALNSVNRRFLNHDWSHYPNATLCDLNDIATVQGPGGQADYVCKAPITFPSGSKGAPQSASPANTAAPPRSIKDPRPYIAPTGPGYGAG